MPDNLDKIGSPDSLTISSQDHERRDWAEVFKTDQETLAHVIDTVGNRVEDVKEFFDVDDDD